VEASNTPTIRRLTPSCRHQLPRIAPISGLTNGGSYIYYVKCQDGQGNTNATDYTISFTVAADTTSPTVNVTAPLNNATVSGNTVTISADATDDVSVAGVQFKLDTNTNVGAGITSAPYSTTWNSTTIADGTHTIVGVARDGSGNFATSSVITIDVDNTAPVRSNAAPSGTLPAGTSPTTLSLTTDEAATCKYDTTAGVPYASMANSFTTTGGTTHSVSVSTSNESSYTYYTRCEDGQANTNSDDYTISFSVVAPAASNGVSSGGGSSGGGGGPAGIFALAPPTIATLAPTSNTGTLSENQIQSILLLLASFNADQATINNINSVLHGQTAGTSPSLVPVVFTRNLELNDTGADIAALQQFLNTHGFPVAPSGPGSPGDETDYFGLNTYRALIKLQKSRGLPQTGYLGPLTRAALGSTPPTSPPTDATTSAATSTP
jgi:hypothetical protein